MCLYAGISAKACISDVSQGQSKNNGWCLCAMDNTCAGLCQKAVLLQKGSIAIIIEAMECRCCDKATLQLESYNLC